MHDDSPPMGRSEAAGTADAAAGNPDAEAALQLAEQAQAEKAEAEEKVKVLEGSNSQLQEAVDSLRAQLESAQHAASQAGRASIDASPFDESVVFELKTLVLDVIRGLAGEVNEVIEQHAAYLASDAAKVAQGVLAGEDPALLEQLRRSVESRARTLAGIPQFRAKQHAQKAIGRLAGIAERWLLGLRIPL